MKIKDFVSHIILAVIIIIFFQWRLSVMESKISDLQSNVNHQIENSFKVLGDSVSARSEVKVVENPNLIDKLFNTALNKQYKEIQKMIPEAVRGEIKKLKIDNKLTTINKTSFIIEGDSAYYLNSEGIVTKTAKVEPINGDSSLLIIVPQEIELTTVQVTPNKEDPTKINLFVTAFNKTTGDSLRIDKAVTYVLEGKTKKWNFNYKPYAGVNYDLNSGIIPVVGINPITYNGKKVVANFGGLEIKTNVKTKDSSIELKILQIQVK